MFNLFNMSFLKMWVPCSHFGTLFTRKSSALESRRFPGDSRDWPIALGAQTHQVHPTQPGRSLRRNGEPIVTVETKSNKSHVGITRRLHYCINYCLHIPCHRSRLSRLTWINGGFGTLLVLLGSYLHHTCIIPACEASFMFLAIIRTSRLGLVLVLTVTQGAINRTIVEWLTWWNLSAVETIAEFTWNRKNCIGQKTCLSHQFHWNAFRTNFWNLLGGNAVNVRKKTMSNGTALYTFLPDPPCPLLHRSWRPADLAPSVTRIHT